MSDIPVKIIKSTEFWSELVLGDGTVLVYKPVIMSMMRIPGSTDVEGHPAYGAQYQMLMKVSSSTPELKALIEKEKQEPEVRK